MVRQRPQNAEPAASAWGALAALALAVVGCGRAERATGLESIDQLDTLPRLVEVTLGEFSIPAPGLFEGADGKLHYRNYLHMRFRMHALVSPEDEPATRRLLERRRGMVRDRVITVCRSAPPDDLQDPHLTALRSRTLDAIQPIFDGHMVHRVFFTDVLCEPL